LRRLTPILIILILAAVTRITSAGHWPVWTDEGWSTWAASDHRLEVILDKVAGDRHPPLYFLSLSAWWTTAGNSRIALRFLSIAGGILAVAVVYRIGRDWFGLSAAFYSAFLLAVLDVAIYFSQEIRHYSWLVLSVCLMTLCFLRYLRQPRLNILILYTLSTPFMLYSLYIGVLILAVQILVGLFVWRGSRRDKGLLILAWIGAAVLYLPWLVALSRQLGILVGGIDGYPSTLAGLLTVATILFGGQLALTIGLYMLGFWRIMGQRDRSVRWLAQFTIVLSGAGLLILMCIANLKIGMLSGRTLVYLAPMLMLICGYGLSLFDLRTQRIMAAVLGVVMLATTEFSQPRLDYHVAAQAVAAEYSPGDLVILENGWDDNAFRYEVLLALPGGEANNAQVIRTLPWVDNRNTPVPVVPHVLADINAHRRVWIVNWYQPSQVIPFLAEGDGGFIRAISRETREGEQYKFLYNAPFVREVLFERPDLDQPPRMYGDLLALRDSILVNQLLQGDQLHVDLWWSAEKPLPLDYSVGVFLMDVDGVVKAQHDGPPGDTATSQWTPGGLTFDRHTLTIPGDLPIGNYKIGVQVYWFGDRQALAINGEKYAIIGDVEIREH
jgi:hypothetical protein